MSLWNLESQRLKIPGKKGENDQKKGIPCKRKKQGNPKKQGKED